MCNSHQMAVVIQFIIYFRLWGNEILVYLFSLVYKLLFTIVLKYTFTEDYDNLSCVYHIFMKYGRAIYCY